MGRMIDCMPSKTVRRRTIRIMKHIFTLVLGAVLMLGCIISPEVRMHEAAFYGDAHAVQRHLEDGVNANAMTRSGTTSLHASAYRGNVAVVELLLAHGANPNYMDGRGWIPLHQAVDQGHAGVAQMLINAGANLNARISGVGYTPLDWAYHRQWPELAERIRKHGGKTGEELEAAGK